MPKQVQTLAGKAVVAVAVESLAAGGCTEAVVVIKEGMAGHVSPALAASPIPVHLVTGGASRQESVHRGLEAVAADPDLARCEVVLVHDAVRPLVPPSVVGEVIETVRSGSVAVAPAIAVVDTIRQVDGDTSTVIDRSSLRAVQTPQGFDREILTQCHRRLAEDGAQVTDDLACVERYGHPVVLVAGSRMAHKITEPLDMDIVSTFASASSWLGGHRGRRVKRALTAMRPRWWHGRARR